MKIVLSLLIIVFSIIGISDSSFITYEKFANIIPDCGAGFDCETVLTSKWSNIGPIPLSLLGLFFYLTIFTLGILNYVEFDFKIFINKLTLKIGLKKNNLINLLTIPELLLALSIFGALFSTYLIFLMGVVIGSWCKYCLISAFSSFSLFLICSIYYSKFEKNSPFLIKKTVISIIHFLYTKLLKKVFFLLDPELIHDFMTSVGKNLGSNQVSQFFTSIFFSFKHEKLKKTIDGIEFNNPVGLSAGFDYNGNLTQILPSVGFGFHTIGTVTYGEYEGNKKPRLGRFLKSKSLIVNKGLKSLGAKTIVANLTGMNFTVPIGISISSTNKFYKTEKDQIIEIIKAFNIFEKSKVKHSYYELNISCPNTFGGEPFSSPRKLKLLLSTLEKLKVKKPIYIKMPIDQSKIETLEMLKIIDKFSIAGVIFGNLTKDKSNPDIHPEDRKSWMSVKGNLSGKPTWKRSNELIKLTKKHFKNRFTIIGTGGIFNGDNAIEKMKNGADLVQLITGMIFEGPQTIGEINLKLAQKALNEKAN